VLALLPPDGLRKEGKQVTQKQYYELAKILSTIADPVEREQIGRAVAALCREMKPTYDANGNARLNQQHFMADVTGFIDLKRA
jgi:TPP-dependent 2-oxoacid decarboxylase